MPISIVRSSLNPAPRSICLNSDSVRSKFDYMAWGMDVVSRVNSPRVKILSDIYHAQILERDIDESQELNYRFIAQAIVDLNHADRITEPTKPRNCATFLS